MKRTVTSLPLHGGKAPPWLFNKMKRLSAAIVELIVLEFGTKELLARIADPVWFQAMGCLVGFDWHSSGVTTTLCGAIKEGVKLVGDAVPLAVCGGKGRTSIKTPEEIARYGDRWGIDVEDHIARSRLCAKIDNTAVQDGHNLYHHVYFFTRNGDWAIVQQGMNGDNRTARRYQWLSQDAFDPVCEPHTGITCDIQEESPLNLVALKSGGTREAIVDFTRENPDLMIKTWSRIVLSLPKRHYISTQDVDIRRLARIFTTIHEAQPVAFKDLIALRGVGPKTVSALALVSELVYQKPPSFEDPARFSFAHGGKDGYPFPVDKRTYEHTIDYLKICIDKAKLGDREKMDAFQRLCRFTKETE